MKLLIANRGEIALRIIRTCREIGIETVAVYCDSEHDAQYVLQADEAYIIGADAQAFLDAKILLAIAKRAQASAVHPGYGFLSESAEFAAQVTAAGLVWIGPQPQVLRQLGDKASARNVAKNAQVATVPGLESETLDKKQVTDFVSQYGFPIVLKKVDGGGGRGIHVLRDEKQLAEYFQRNDLQLRGVVLEKYLENARHLETQCLRDYAGNFHVLSTRDCSVQRRNQKLIEEAPAFNLPGEIERKLIDSSARLFAAVNFVGVGTCEFLYEAGELYFLEVNPRLQVEHTVSEEVTGIDLVRLQLEIAAKHEICDLPPVRGHAIEFRITSEDPQLNMLPTAGVIQQLHWPLGQGVRIDTAIRAGDLITTEFDSMIAKIIVTAPARDMAIARANRALQEFQLSGVATPTQLYLQILDCPEFSRGDFSTRWFEESFLPKLHAQEAVAAENLAPTPAAPANALASPNSQLSPAAHTPQTQTFTIEIDGKRGTIRIPTELLASQRRHTLTAQPLRRSKRIADTQSTQAADGVVNSPIQALVLKVCTSVGAKVAAGDLLVVLESMKMESYVYAPCAGEITELAVADGENVTPGKLIARIQEETNADHC